MTLLQSLDKNPIAAPAEACTDFTSRRPAGDGATSPNRGS
jgi:hypothetical protein